MKRRIIIPPPPIALIYMLAILNVWFAIASLL